jgi:hypothetical protein
MSRDSDSLLIGWMLDQFKMEGPQYRCLSGDCEHDEIDECIELLRQRFTEELPF